jgi:hypothetical protein
VWLVWKSRATYQLKAATLSTLALIATPYGFATDMAAIAISSAFLASDQIRRGVLKGEQAIMIALFGMSLLILPTFGRVPLGPLVVIVLSGVILRRALYYGAQRTIFSPGECYTDRLPPVASPSQTG